MTRHQIIRGAAGAVLAVLLLPLAPASSQMPRVAPAMQPVAETRLLMEGLNQANFRGLERLLSHQPTDAATWTFIRGQSLLIAESGNLLMLRPPRDPQAYDAWMRYAAELRTAGERLARNAGTSDYERSRASLNELANTCNRCHQAFRVPTRITPFAADNR
ncbi:MAG: hypothetical protein ACK4RK_12900 [Gemmataceae bacterium]